MRVVFFGNNVMGVIVLGELSNLAEVVGVVAHPLDPEEGMVYPSVFQAARQASIPALRCRGKDPTLREFVRALAPDLIWITDYRYLLPESVFGLAPLGAVNLHPSLLPRYRGRAPVNWAIINGEEHLGLTAHFVDAGMDTGDIITQEQYHLRPDQDVAEALDMLYPLYRRITRKVVGCFAAGEVPRGRQEHALATAFPRRRPEDGVIDWTRKASDIYNLIRAVARPYPGAYGYLAGRRFTVWKASLDAGKAGPGACAGSVLENDGQSVRVMCADAPLRLTEIDVAGLNGATLRPGSVLDPAPGSATLRQMVYP